ncbi:hypothetical protein ACFSTI_14350 [Rhizorhabdus histidinilytica]
MADQRRDLPLSLGDGRPPRGKQPRLGQQPAGRLIGIDDLAVGPHHGDRLFEQREGLLHHPRARLLFLGLLDQPQRLAHMGHQPGEQVTGIIPQIGPTMPGMEGETHLAIGTQVHSRAEETADPQGNEARLPTPQLGLKEIGAGRILEEADPVAGRIDQRQHAGVLEIGPAAPG